MEQVQKDMILPAYDKKSWLKSCLLGFFIGLAVIVPGISGSTVAIIFKLYDQFLYAVGNILKKFKQCFLFLLPIGIGVVVGGLLGLIGVKQLLTFLPFAIVCLFAGLMSGAFPAVQEELKGSQRTPKCMILFAVGLLIPVIVGCVSALLSTKEGGAGDIFATVQWWQVLIAVVIGYLFAITQIVPGLSGSALLMMIGWFHCLMDSISLTYWKNNPAIFLIYFGLGIGFLLGLITFSKFLTYLFGKARNTAYSMIVGLSLGSIISMFCNGDIINTYLLWAQNGVQILDLILGVLLFIGGMIGSYTLVRYQRKKDADKSIGPMQV